MKVAELKSILVECDEDAEVLIHCWNTYTAMEGVSVDDNGDVWIEDSWIHTKMQSNDRRQVK